MTKSSTSAKHASKEAVALSYEQALAELEQLLAGMEAGQLPLDQLLESYRRGAELLGFCRAKLQAVEQQVKVLEGEGLKQWGDS
ncbi:exodeoxyribonuclease VII small subunit [Roseateles oligotrophus]|uniref:exodeoxyribonuclease VII small subunit n=1 Tax=Roseateles oligotrophus TaxID=1769250 RepID=UPI0016151630|nr:exodeoxyribonuclease VII small subunit [Roseateles oligotrophus]